MGAKGTEDGRTIHSSLDLLTVRLRRLEFLLSASSDLDGVPNGVGKPSNHDNSVLGRLQFLQSSLEKLRKDNGVAGEMIRDIEALHAQHPELQKSPPGLSVEDVATQASIVLANATLYPETASRLASLKTLQIPPVESSSKLNELNSDILKCQQHQDSLNAEINELRQRSARCLEWWVKTGVVGMGDLWEEWETRMVELQRQVAALERRKIDEEGYI